MGHLERRFEAFLTARAREPEDLLEAMREWVRQGLEGLVGAAAAADLPWQE
jgi:hypothetical protein